MKRSELHSRDEVQDKLNHRCWHQEMWNWQQNFRVPSSTTFIHLCHHQPSCTQTERKKHPAFFIGTLEDMAAQCIEIFWCFAMQREHLCSRGKDLCGGATPVYPPLTDLLQTPIRAQESQTHHQISHVRYKHLTQVIPKLLII